MCSSDLKGHEPYSRKRYYWGAEGGRSILAVLRREFERERAAGRIDLRLQTPVSALLTDSAGAVRGVRVKSTDREQVFSARHVLLTCGGYGSNAEMFERLSGYRAYAATGVDAIFLAVGAGLPVFMEVPGEQLKGVYSANEYLTRVNLMGAWRSESETPVLHGQRVAVVGGGNVAMDAVRTARRMGAEAATIVYRRGEDELPARREEVHHAQDEGVAFELLAAPTEVLGDEQGWVRALRCDRMALTDPDATGRRGVRRVDGASFELPCDIVVVAIGTKANPLLTASEPDLQVNEWGYLVVDEDGMTSIPGVFAGGDIVRGAATVILAMGDGKRAAAAIDRFLARMRELRAGGVATAG